MQWREENQNKNSGHEWRFINLAQCPKESNAKFNSTIETKSKLVPNMYTFNGVEMI